jgi:cytochrome P450
MPDQPAVEQTNLLDELKKDPYAVFRKFRSAGPVGWLGQHWYIMGHREAMAALRDTRLVSSLDFDAAGYARRRALVQNTFTPAFVEQHRRYAQRMVDEVLDAAAARGEMELVGALASPLASAVAAELVGLPEEDRPAVGAWVRRVSNSIDPALGHCQRELGGGPLTPPGEVRRRLAELVVARREHRRDDLTSRLVEVGGPDDRPDDAEVVGICVELLVSAHDSVVNLIGNGVAALLDNPGERDRLCAQPDLITTGIDEILRYDAPVQLISRFLAEDVELGGHAMRKGQRVMILVGAANRDPEVFEAPDMLDLSRSPNHHVAFGRGLRLCLGAPLARMVGQVAIGSLFARFPKIRMVGTPTPGQRVSARGFTYLPVAL